MVYMFRTRKKTSLVISLILLSLLSLAMPSDAQAETMDLLMTNMKIHADLGTDCDTIILLETGITNIGSTEFDSFNLRVDVRGLEVNIATLNGTPVESTTRSVDNFVLVTFHSNSTIMPGSHAHFFLNFTTKCLQERIGLNSDRTMYDSQLIYYIRSLYEIQNLTFYAALPQHAIIDLTAAAPLYPNPTANHTDGNNPVFTWHTDLLLPGQEIVYIIKYQIPAALFNTAAESVTSNPIFIVILSAILAGLAVLIIERIPGWIKNLNAKEIIVSGKISTQEQEILDLLGAKGGSCTQREIYENLDMSQSMTSMMLTSLEGRGLIRRLRSGRENIVHIMED